MNEGPKTKDRVKNSMINEIPLGITQNSIYIVIDQS